MKKFEKTLSVQEIKSLEIKEDDVLGFDFERNGEESNYYLTLNGKNIIAFVSPKERKNTLNKIQRMGLGYGWVAPQLTDEEQGIIDASKNGENPFAYSIMCSNPSLNEIVKK